MLNPAPNTGYEGDRDERHPPAGEPMDPPRKLPVEPLDRQVAAMEEGIRMFLESLDDWERFSPR